jgi:putative copper resistance protein D
MHHDMSDMAGMQQSQAAPQETPEQNAEYLEWKRDSEFNHRLAGALIIMAALFFLAQPYLEKRLPALRYAWPTCFLAAGLFLLLFSDTEIWPFGYMSFYYAVTHNLEDAQHKTFSLILLVIGVVEIMRSSGRLKAAWAAWVFPMAALGGTVLLLFHQHGGMHGSDAMQTMMRVQHQHLEFAEAGAAVVVTKALAETNTRWQTIFNKLWPLFMVLLGVLLLLYTE